MATQVSPGLVLATSFIAALQYRAIKKSKYFLTALRGNLQFIISFHGAINASWQAESQLLIIWQISRFFSKISFSFSSIIFWVFLQILAPDPEISEAEWQVDALLPFCRCWSKPWSSWFQRALLQLQNSRDVLLHSTFPLGIKSGGFSVSRVQRNCLFLFVKVLWKPAAGGPDV